MSSSVFRAAHGLAAATLVFGATPALAAPAAPGTVEGLTVIAPTTVEELTVVAAAKCLEPDKSGASASRPKIVSTFPHKGDVVRPGLVVLRVTFDRPMACYGAFSADPPFADPCPHPTQHLVLSYDRRTVRTVCAADPGGHYGVAMNRDLIGGSNFTGLSGLPSESRAIDFTTSSAPAVVTVCDALAEDQDGVRQIAKLQTLDCSKARPAAGG